MASKERIQRLKDDTRNNILEASLQIVKEEGWSALSMRKIADRIEYTAPIIYEYFNNKDAILQELTRKGYVTLANQMEEAQSKFPDPAQQLEAMWRAYWNFAFTEKELYQVMYGVEMNCCVLADNSFDFKLPSAMFRETIEKLLPAHKRTEEYVERRYYIFWSVVHGLISIIMTRQLTSEIMKRQVLNDTLSDMITAIRYKS